MAMTIRKAQRRKAKLRMALVGPTGSGKTYSSLRLAFGIGAKIGIIDTENGSADLYADLGDYDVITLEKPYTVANYREALAAFEDAGYDVIIVDSLTHAWAGSGGLLDKQGQVEKKTHNSYTAWREITPEHNSLVEALLTSPAHIIATMRVKTEYVMEQDSRGKMVPRKVGLAPVFRDGIEYEFTLVMDIDADHRASASKDRTKIFRGWYDEITERTGKTLLDWLESGADTLPTQREPEAPAPKPRKTISQWLDELEAAISEADTKDKIAAIVDTEEVAKAKTHFTNGSKERLDGLLAHAEDKMMAMTVTFGLGLPATTTETENYEWPTAEEAA